MDLARHRDRLACIGEAMARAATDLLFLPPGADMQYLTGVPLPRLFWAGDGDIFRLADADGCLVPANGDPVLTFADSVWSRDVRRELEAWTSFGIEDGWPHWMLHQAERTIELFRRAGTSLGFARGRLAVDDWTPVRQLELLRRAFPDAELVPAGSLLLEARMTKDADEIELLRQAQEASQLAHDEALRAARPGMAVGELADELALQLHRQGAETLSFPPDLFVVGPNVSVTYSDNDQARRNARLDPPCVVCIDLGGVFSGYCSDLARTVFFGEPDPRQHAALGSVKEAQRAGVAAIRPGVSGEDVDRAARRVVDNAGLGDAFWTGAGHGIGLQIHEPPALMHGTTTSLMAGMVLAVEVGTWIDGKLGAFCEDLVVVHEDGAEWLSQESEGDHVIE
jgi:Xaa-Pro aminopeptidase